MDSLDAKLVSNPDPGHRRSPHLMDAPLRDALEGAVFPLSRDHLVFVARENDATATLVTLLSGLPRRLYGSLDEIERILDGQAREEAVR